MRAFYLASVLFLAFGTAAAQNFYDINTIQRIEIVFNQSNWDYILDTAKQGSDSYLMSKWVKINGVQFDSAGVKYKGNSSYNPNNVKNPLHIELDHFKEQDYLGYKDIKLSNGYNEPSFVREVYLYQTFQTYAEASKANFAQVLINGTYMGVYTNVEAVTKNFLDNRFYSDNNTFVFGDLGGCDLRYKGNDTSFYYTPYTMKSDYGYTHLMRFCDSLRNNIANIEYSLDVDRNLWLLAYNNVFVTLDSYLGNGKHNYYLYRDHNRRFNHIIWDLNGGIGVFSKIDSGPALTITQMENMTPLLHANDTAWPLVNKVLSVPMYKRMYIAHLKTLVNENLASGTYSVFMQQLHNIADTAVFSDPNKFGSYTQFQSNLTTTVVLGPKTVPGLFPFLNARKNYLQSTTEFQQAAPTITNVNSSVANPALNSTVFITANVGNANAVFLGKRYSLLERFYRVQMFDDGAHGDGASGDGVYGVAVPVNNVQIHYYIYAENANAGLFSPQRAEHDYYTITAAGSPAPGQIVINEFLAQNNSDATNELSNFEDWIELFNTTSTPLNLGGYYITDNFSNKIKYQFAPNTIIPANGFLSVWADEATTLTTAIHVNFQLNEGGEQLMLSNGSSVIIDSVSFGNQTANISWGRCPDGTGAFGPLNVTSKGALNCGVAIKEQLQGNSVLTIYPIPASDQLIVNYQGAASKLEMLDVMGRKVYETDFKNTNAIDVRSFENGTYLILIKESAQVIGSKKVVILHK
jgi:hypothetical protein